MTASEAAAGAIRAVDIIRKKRDGHELTRAEISFLIRGYSLGKIPDYQMSAWLMAALLKGLNREETAILTEAMLHSGEVLDLSEFSAAKIDKHSTGGVGDKTSLILAPLAAAGGLVVPKISGRGLGHTGGTVVSPGNGYVAAIQCEQVGTACALLGGGREKKEDAVDPAVGIVLHKKVGDRVAVGEALCTLMYNSETRAASARALLEKSYRIADSPPAPRKLIRRIIPESLS